MDLRLEGKHALVTGSSSGIGEAIAKLLAREGAHVVVHGRNAQRTNEVARQIVACGGTAVAALGDLSSEEGARAVVDVGMSHLGSLDILINNAGEYKSRPWMDVSPEDWDRTYLVNVVSMVRLIHAVVPQMKSRGWGRIIQISSRVALRPRADMPDYAASKAAVLNLTVSLAKELALFGIGVNAVSAGIILTEAVEARFRSLARQKGWPEDWAEIERNVMRELEYDPAVRLGRPEDVAHLVAFLSSPLADAISGSNFRVDGGGAGVLG